MTYQMQPPPAPKKKMGAGKKVLIGAGVIFGLTVVGAVASGGSEDQVDSTPKAAATKAAPAKKSDDKPKKVEGDDGSQGAKKTQFYKDGDYEVGKDIPAGTYESEGASSDIFDFCAITTEPKDSSVMPKIKSANKGERVIITLTPADGTVTIQGCSPLSKR